MRQFILIMCVLTFLFVTACSEDSSTGPEPADDNSNGEIDNPKDENPVTAFKFSEIQDNVFSVSCAFSGCHDTATKRGNLDLSETNAYGNLVNVASTGNPDMLRVAPGSSSDSYLIAKLTGNGTSQMPPNGNALSQETIDKIKAWIDDGAQNN
ncbi:MAG: hypothetical protein DWQ10_02210 [Calditrichaeota bacterium]|nr:MAG: hypothetical protein DWQ10_02210 [Calditrichota bacterium]